MVTCGEGASGLRWIGPARVPGPPRDMGEGSSPARVTGARGYPASMSDALVVNESDGQCETWSDDRGEVSFRTIFGADPITSEFTAGVADLGPGGWLGHHRHEPSEVYYVLRGTGIVVIDGEEYAVSAGNAVYIPSNSEHGIRNSGDDPLQFFYVFAVGGSFDQIEYRFTVKQ